MQQDQRVAACLYHLPWCCLSSLLVLSLSSLAFLQPMTPAASALILISWAMLATEGVRARKAGFFSRSLVLSATGCLLATVAHLAMLYVSGQDCIMASGLHYLYWTLVISPEAPLSFWSIG